MTGVLVRRDRALLRVFGRDPLKMIQGLATNDIAGVPVNATVYTAFLTPKGKMVGDARVVRRENGDLWIEADAAAAQNLVANFRKFVPPLFARFESLERGVIELVGENAEPIAARVEHELQLSNPFRPDAVDLVVQDAAAAQQTSLAAGATLLDETMLEVLRIEAGEPKWGAELTEDVIPLEAGLRHVAISETKGCYTGQEVIVRILHRGHVNRHLRGLAFDGADIPAIGAEIGNGEKMVGQVTSACYSQKLGQAIALGYVRREVVPSSVVNVADRTAQVIELPFVPTEQHGFSRV